MSPSGKSSPGGGSDKVLTVSVDETTYESLKEIAERNRIPYQREVLVGGTTDASAIQLVRSGVPVGCVSIPCRYVHSASEMIDIRDAENALKLVVALLKTGVAPSDTPAVAAPASTVTDDHDRANLAETAIRVDVDLLDKLMNVVGELVLTRNQILQHVNAQADGALMRISQRLNHITTELQEGVMKTRMQPISTLWNTYPRLMRDLELHTGKQVQLVREGGDTELDRTLLQAIKDPLMHILRNAVDHGLEAPAARKAVGKPAVGNTGSCGARAGTAARLADHDGGSEYNQG